MKKVSSFKLVGSWKKPVDYRSLVFTGLLIKTKIEHMRKTILLLSFITFYVYAFAQDSSKIKSQSLPFFSCCYFPPKEPEMPRIFIRCASPKLVEPLYVIDGVVASTAELRKVDPDNIDSIWVLKNSAATTLFCSRSVNGVIVITTKKTDERIIEVRDKSTGESLSFATIAIMPTGKRRTDPYTADSLGRVKIKIAPDKGYGLVVSHVGYNDSKVWINTRKKEKQKVIYLERIQSEAKIKVYPNPVVRPNDITLKFESKNESKVKLNLFSINNKLISSNEFQLNVGINWITHPINAQLSAGTYFIQLMDENYKLIKTQKLIIQ